MSRTLALVALAALAAGCTSYELSLTPAPLPLPAPPAVPRHELTITVDSTYAPFVDGALDAHDRYPRDGRLGDEDSEHYRDAFARTGWFRNVTLGDARLWTHGLPALRTMGDGLHCRLTIVSGREPARELLRTVSILFTAGLLAHHQREIVSLRATVTAPGRGPGEYAFDALVTSDATHRDSTLLRRDFIGPERDIVAALVARLVADGWLAAEAR